MFKKLALISAFVGALALAAVPVQADQLYVCQPAPGQDCTSAPGGTAVGGETNLITNTGSFDIGNSGNHTQDNPLLIVVAVINGHGIPSVSFSGCTIPSACTLAAVGTYGLTANTVTGFNGGIHGTGTAFAALGLAAGGSESFGNLAGADMLNGFGTPTSFTLYTFAVPTALSGNGGPITIDESGAAPGSLILAYSCASGDPTTSACSGGDIGQTVNTNTGLATGTLPEPASLTMLGMGLFGIAGFSRRRSLKS